MNESIIKLSGITKTYALYTRKRDRLIEAVLPFLGNRHNDFHALSDISFEIEKGECVGIIGKNGSGKSTLLKIITEILHPTSGSVEVKGRVSALLELGAGFNPDYTGIENVYLNGIMMGVKKEEMEKKLPDIINFADIGDFINQPVKNYSSGMFVRLAFAVAINVEPDILIVDEALSVGDAAFQAKCMAKMGQIMKKGTTILFVTHDMNTVKRLCKRCIYLKNGKKVMEGPAEEIADVYLREIREQMNEEHKNIIDYLEEDQSDLKKQDENIDEGIMNSNVGTIRNILIVTEGEFDKKVKLFREGTGDVKITDFEFTDEDDKPIKIVEFNQKVKLKIQIEFYEEMSVCVGYHIRDDKNTELVGTYTILEGVNEISGKIGDKYFITFETRLPLIEGAYSITLIVSKEIIKNRTALFIDYIENVEVFEIEENMSAKLWDKVYIDNNLSINKIEG